MEQARSAKIDGETAPFTLEIVAPDGASGRVPGFNSIWAKYVNGFDPSRSCHVCLRGSVIHEFSGNRVASGRLVILEHSNAYPYVYVCGVASGREGERGHKNVHFPLRAAPGKCAELPAYNGYVFRATNAEIVQVNVQLSELKKEWPNFSEPHLRCKCFQFGVAVFGAGATTSSTSSAEL